MRIAVVGAGPSGSRAAAGLAALGHEVALIDRSFDREKPCGGGVPAAGLRSLFVGSTRALADRPPNAVAPDPVSRPAEGFCVRTLALSAPSGAVGPMTLGGPLQIFGGPPP